MSSDVMEIDSDQASLHIKSLARNLVREDAETFLSTRRHEVYHFWASLLASTTLREGATSKRVLKALLLLERRQKRSRSRPEFSRLVNIRVAQLLPQLKDAIKKEARSKKLRTAKGRGVTTIAIDLHQASLSTTRKNVQSLWRISKRWNILSTGSPTLSIILTNKAEKLIQDFSVTLGTFKSLAKEINALTLDSLARETLLLARAVKLSTEKTPTTENVTKILKQLDITKCS